MAAGNRKRSAAVARVMTRQAALPLNELNETDRAHDRERPAAMGSGPLGWQVAAPPSPGQGFTASRLTPLLDMQQALGNRAVQRVLQHPAVPPSIAVGARRHTPGVRHALVPAVQQRALQRDEAAPARPKKAVTSTALRRLAHAQAAIAHTKSVLSFGAGNQAEAIRATNANSVFRMQVLRDENNEYWEIHPSVYEIVSSNPEAFTAAKADVVHGGNDGEHTSIAFDYLRVHAVGETIAMAQVADFDHAFVLIGNATEPVDDLVVADPWPTRATACTWKDHFAYSNDAKIIRHNTITADGKNIKAVIAAGLKLNAKGKDMASRKLSDKETDKLIKGGRQGDHPWIWNHASTASVEYDYVPQERSRR